MSKDRTYLETHPWLKFTLDLRPAPTRLWTMLGECQSKCAHLAVTPLEPGLATKLHTLYLAKGILATTAIEGNTLSEKEVLQHLEGKLKLPPSREYLKQEIDNILNECNRITNEIWQGIQPAFFPGVIKSLNKAVLDKLTLDEGVTPGRIRTGVVMVERYRGAPAEDCDYLLAKLCDWLNEEFKTKNSDEITFALLKAVIAHLYLAWIHPFGDGNGRTTRLVEFLILISAGIPAPACQLLSNHYNQTRTDYYRQLDMASKSGGDVLPFIMYAIQGFTDGLREQINMVNQYQINMIWENHVHKSFKDKNSESDQRKKHLVLDISEFAEPISMDKISELTPRLAKYYAQRTSRTLSRDINELLRMELIHFENNKISANKEKIFGFLPVKAKSVENEGQNLETPSLTQ